VSVDGLSQETGMQSNGDVFCGKSRIISATSSTVAGSRVDSVAELTRARADADVSQQCDLIYPQGTG